MIEIIPAIDLIDGKCVRLEQGDYKKKKVYNEDPLEVAKQFEGAGIVRLHLVDLDGAKAGKVKNLKSLEKIASKTALKVDFGGGIKSDSHIRDVFNAGAVQVTLGSIAVKEPETFEKWLHEYGAESIILGADVKDEKIAVSGWLEVTETDIYAFLDNKLAIGARYVLCTDISKDGMLQGTSMSLYEKINQRYKEIKLIASGGITEMDEIEQLNEMNVYGVIIGKAIYEGRITVSELARFVQTSNK